MARRRARGGRARARSQGCSARRRAWCVDVPETLPRVTADPALLERASPTSSTTRCAWSPADQPVRVVAGRGRTIASTSGSSTTVPASRRPARAGLPAVPAARRQLASGDGVGLGLAVAQGFVEAMGGELTVDDTPGGGTTDGRQPPGGGRRDRDAVLVVDDEPQIRRALGINLRARGLRGRPGRDRRAGARARGAPPPRRRRARSRAARASTASR